jgi:ferredoxin
MSHKKPGYKYENDWSFNEMKVDTEEHLKSALVVPVQTEIKAEHTVLNLDRVKKYIVDADTVSLMDCSCRMKRKHCNGPIEVCIGLNGWADRFVKSKDFQYRHPHIVDKKMALEAIEKSAEAGLVHMAYIYRDNLNSGDPDVICSCCSCCCEILGATLRYGLAPHLLTASAKSSRDAAKCINCGKCVDRCQFGAREMVEGSLIFNPDKCFGCGLCISTCPTGAIKLHQIPA